MSQESPFMISQQTHIETSKTDSKLSCKICGKQVEARSKLEIHMRSHTGAKPYSCTKCDRAFTVLSNLKRHMRTVHSQLRPFKCRYCSKSFNQRCNVRRHELVHSSSGASKSTDVQNVTTVPVVRSDAECHSPVSSSTSMTHSPPSPLSPPLGEGSRRNLFIRVPVAMRLCPSRAPLISPPLSPPLTPPLTPPMMPHFDQHTAMLAIMELQRSLELQTSLRNEAERTARGLAAAMQFRIPARARTERIIPVPSMNAAPQSA